MLFLFKQLAVEKNEADEVTNRIINAEIRGSGL